MLGLDSHLTPHSTTPVDADHENLLYRGQFILGPKAVDLFASPQHLIICQGLHLTVHADLNLQIVRDQGKTIVLLGFILDPENPQAGNDDIIESFVRRMDRCADLFRLTSRFGGRWILIADDGRDAVLFNDAAGLRQVFYSDVRVARNLWCGSDSGPMAELLGLQINPAANQFVHSPEIKRNPEYWWPGDSSPFSEVRHLLPNHYLNLRDGTCRRYWPDEKLPAMPLAAAVQECSRLLAGSLAAAAERFDLALPLTAGWDSRLLLAASKRIATRLSYFTLKIKAANLTEGHPDLAIPRALLAHLGLRHEVIELPEKTDPQFSAVFQQSVALAHDVWSLDAQAILEFYRLQKVVIAGGVSEAARNFYTLPRSLERKLTGEKLASLAGMGRHPFAVTYFNEWLGKLGPTYNFRALDLFYWEQRAGSWLAMCQKEFDVAWSEIFSPYNCRRLLSHMLAVKNVYRRDPNFTLYREMILHLWSDVFAFPINPHKVPSRLKLLRKQFRNQLLNVKYFFVDG
jgi:hypothetical protein